MFTLDKGTPILRVHNWGIMLVTVLERVAGHHRGHVIRDGA